MRRSHRGGRLPQALAATAFLALLLGLSLHAINAAQLSQGSGFSGFGYWDGAGHTDSQDIYNIYGSAFDFMIPYARLSSGTMYVVGGLLTHEFGHAVFGGGHADTANVYFNLQNGSPCPAGSVMCPRDLTPTITSQDVTAARCLYSTLLENWQ